MKITPETYSGVAVVAIEAVESVLSVREPSRIPASTPTMSAEGTMSTITQNISLAVRLRRMPMIVVTGSLKTVEYPQSPCRIPQNVGALAGSTPGRRQRPVVSPSALTPVKPGARPSHSAYLRGKGCV